LQYSYSKLTSFYECPYAFYRNYQKHERGESNLFASYGILVHSILERYAKGELNLEDLVDEFTSSFEMSINEPIIMFGKDLTDSYFDKGVTFFSNFNGFWGLTPLESEYKFEIELGDNTFVGIIDLVAEDDKGNIIIIDHKSSSKFSKKDLKSKSKQLYLYSKAIYDKYGKFPKELWFNHFKNDYREKIEFDKAFYEDTIQWALDTIEAIEACMDFNPNNNDKFYCGYLCDYRNSCEYKQ
jgi:RecB family exonuclease